MKRLQNINNVIVTTSGTEATMLLYGFIGQDFYSERYREESLTDVEFVRQLSSLEKDYDRINIRINSPGGSVYHGNAIITAIQRSKAQIHTYNDGLAASMAFGIWAAAKNRHWAKNATGMVHNVIGGAVGNAKDMRDYGDFLDTYSETLSVILAEAFGMKEEEFNAEYFDYQDHWISYKKATALGIITNKEEYESEHVIENVQNLSYAEIMNQFSGTQDSAPKSWFQRIAAVVLPTKKSIPNNSKSDIDMTKDDFQKSLDDNTLSMEAVTEVLKAKGFEMKAIAEKPTPQPEPQPAATTDADKGITMEALKATIDEAIAPLKTENAELKAELQKLQNAPAGTIAKAPAAVDTDDPLGEDDNDDPLKAFDESMAKAAANAEAVPIR